ncbi:MAG: nuclear transport factor 2 family protein [Pseudomonadota bacterium]
MRKKFLGAILFVTAACAPDAERAAPDAAAGPEADAIRGLMDAFNAHDADAMRAYWTDDVTWIEITGNSSSVVTNSADALHDSLVAYFEAYPDVSSSLENIVVNGDYLSAVERPVWSQGGERKSQSSIVVYEFRDGKVKRFWYYPAQ